ncbi:hypothetical protein LU631_09830 [Erwinia tracheiphila]|uniref:Uncharacterized protein n=1 Tax=Erwinia tracheiphila TaxID=65700 RepID=A0A345CP24_9GAMM|nr:hypothetical protein [Erwinia tracheiphila]AXF75191.1 hypothetical protein AV903_02215 [Erwinia tracheiphila]EOS94052.1 hypothetical protein ETR_15821 [Erwinia tracheiphila PSU-1]UIA82264.1 hypothetical protein LU604_16965 [Erwinia tracheiphila]UIA89457.1 hypothetical protein LU631_09830 [Erwinia tracheiphila]UIA90861.1 hypothetical protein LU632_16555 [Erwinia tracheiphila]
MLAISTGLISFWARNINEDQKKFRDELRDIRDNYQRRDDAHRDFQQIMAMLQRIEQKLDKKADK